VSNDRRSRRVRLYRWASNAVPAVAWFRLYPLYERLIRRRRFLRFKASRLAGHVWRLDFEEGSSLHIVTPQRLARYREGAVDVLDAMRYKYVDPTWDLSGDKVVLDVGANIGEFSLALLDENPALHIYCFEPDPSVIPALRLNLGITENARIIQVALGEEDVETAFFVSSADADSSLVRPERIEREIKVGERRLDAFFGETHLSHIALLKIDAEGAEPEVLRGARATLERVQHVAVDAGPERRGQSTMPEVTGILTAAGFSCRPNPLQGSVVLGDRSSSSS
jgi:FkbM family methyltransferase